MKLFRTILVREASLRCIDVEFYCLFRFLRQCVPSVDVFLDSGKSKSKLVIGKKIGTSFGVVTEVNLVHLARMF